MGNFGGGLDAARLLPVVTMRSYPVAENNCDTNQTQVIKPQ